MMGDKRPIWTIIKDNLMCEEGKLEKVEARAKEMGINTVIVGLKKEKKRLCEQRVGYVRSNCGRMDNMLKGEGAITPKELDRRVTARMRSIMKHRRRQRGPKHIQNHSGACVL